MERKDPAQTHLTVWLSDLPRWACNKWPGRSFWARRKDDNRTAWKHHEDFVIMEAEFCIFIVAEETAKLFAKNISFVSWPQEAFVPSLE